MGGRPAFALVLSLALTSAAYSQEVVRKDASQADPKPAAADAAVSGDEQTQAEADGAWARAVMDRAAAGKSSGSKAGCVRNHDRAPHGEVWAGAGSNGYRDVGGVVTEPIGNCSTLTVGYDQGSDNLDYGRGRRGR
jgi:hypothetical protein